MKILSVYSDKINGVLSSFDRIIINGYLLNLQNSRQFLYYLIQNNVQLVDFAPFAQKKTKALEAGMKGHISKPMDVDKLKHEITLILSKK